MKRSDYMLAALASAVLPNLGVAGVRENVQASATDEAKGIDQTVIQDASGKLDHGLIDEIGRAHV